jgi:hypothetical protein
MPTKPVVSEEDVMRAARALLARGERVTGRGLRKEIGHGDQVRLLRIWTDVGEFMLLVFSPDGVPTWEVRHRTKIGSSGDDLIVTAPPTRFKRRRLRRSSRQVHSRCPQNENVSAWTDPT